MSHPCYCLPGEARCDEPYNWCDRAEREVAALQRVRALADHWDTDEDARYSSNRIAKQTAARAIREALSPIAVSFVVRNKEGRDQLSKLLGLTVYRMDTGEVEVYVGGTADGWTVQP